MTVCFIHGFTGRAASFDQVVDRLDPSRRIVHLTLPGHGPHPAPVLGWEDTVSHFVERLRAEEVEHAHLVGYSMGGRLALSLLARAPERFGRATVIGAHPGLSDASERRARRESDQRLAQILRERGLDAFVELWSALPLFDTQRRLSPVTLERQRAIRRSHTAQGLAEALLRLGLAEMPAVDPQKIEVPLRWVVGTEDRRLRERLDRVLPRQPLLLIDDAGHNVVLERPEVIAALVGGSPS